MSRLLPKPTRDSLVRFTLVILDMEDFPNPKSLDPYSINDQIKSAIASEGYRGHLSIHAYADEDMVSDECQDKFYEAGIVISRYGHKGLRLNMMLVSAFFWAMTIVSSGHSANFLLLSKNKNIEQDPNFSSFRKALERKGFNVVLAQPDTLINLDGGSGSEKDGFNVALAKPLNLASP